MGAGQSSGRAAEGGEQAVKTSFYELLGVDRQATEEEIKKAYRRKALELHPDRNYGNEQEATAIFADVQAAYEVLSDPQERAWYDSHESAILRGDDGQGDDEAPSYQNVRVTSADDLARLVRKFNTSVEFTDAPSGFFGFLRETFDHLAKEEEIAGNWENVDTPDYPGFGHKDDGYDDVVRKFYAAWINFATVKSFAWKDKYRLSEAPDRWYRRRMEQENKACRKEGIREFNEAVRSFVAFVRKRDPRYVPSTQSEAERQKVLRDAAASQAARARAANQDKLSQEVPDWAKAREPEEEEEDEGSEEEEVVEEVLECVACNKTFKSEKQFEAHERSKKHQKAVYALQKKMRKDNAHLDLDDSLISGGVATPDIDDETAVERGHADNLGAGSNGSIDREHTDDLEAGKADHTVEQNGHVLIVHSEDEAEVVTRNEASPTREHPAAESYGNSPPAASEEDSGDSDYASPEAIRSRLEATSLETPASTVIGDDDEGTDSNQPTQRKMGKAAQKRAKKAATAAAAEHTVNPHKCATCNAGFPSKTRLFQHIKDHGHEALKLGPAGGAKGKKGRGKR